MVSLNMDTNERPRNQRTVPPAQETRAALLRIGIDYRFNQLINTDEFKIEEEWTTDSALARSLMRTHGDEALALVWKEAMALAGPQYRWHPWKHLDKLMETITDELVCWPVYAAIQRMILPFPPHQPVFVTHPWYAGDIMPRGMRRYEPQIFHHLASDGTSRGRMVGEARKSGKVGILPTRNPDHYEGDERFYICGDVSMRSLLGPDTAAEVWETMYRMALTSPYRVADPEPLEHTEDFLPPTEKMLQDIEEAYDGGRFSLYDMLIRLYWTGDREAAENALRYKHVSAVQKLSLFLRKAGFVKSSRGWSHPGIIEDQITEVNMAAEWKTPVSFDERFRRAMLTQDEEEIGWLSIEKWERVGRTDMAELARKQYEEQYGNRNVEHQVNDRLV